MSKGVVCEPGRHPITFATPKSLHNIADNTNSKAWETLCVWLCVCCSGISLNEATKSWKTAIYLIKHSPSASGPKRPNAGRLIPWVPLLDVQTHGQVFLPICLIHIMLRHYIRETAVVKSVKGVWVFLKGIGWSEIECLIQWRRRSPF